MVIFVKIDCLKSLFKLIAGYEVHLIRRCLTDKCGVMVFAFFPNQFVSFISFSHNSIKICQKEQ